MTGADSHGRGTGDSFYDARDGYFPGVPYNNEHFNQCSEHSCPTSSCCIDDWNNILIIRNCRLLNLIDLNTGMDYVRQVEVSRAT